MINSSSSLKLESYPGGRVTHSDIDTASELFLKDVLPLFLLNQDVLSPNEMDAMNAALPGSALLAAQLKRTALAAQNDTSSQIIFEQIQAIESDLLFDFLGSEAGIAMEAVLIEAEATGDLTEVDLTQALNLDPASPKDKIERYSDANDFFPTFLDLHTSIGKGDSAQTFIDIMQQQTSSQKLVVIGEDNHPSVESEHPVYILGIANDGNLVGAKSIVVWT